MIQVAPWVRTLVQVGHPDENVQRRGQNLILLAVGLIALGVPMVLVAVTQPGGLVSLSTAVLIMLGLAVVVGVARRGHVGEAAVAMIGLIVVGFVGASLVGGRIGLVPFFLPLSLMIAAITLTPRMVVATTAVVVAAISLLGVVLMGVPQEALRPTELLSYGVLLNICGGMICALGAATTERALQQARSSRMAAEQNAVDLDRANADLERQRQTLQEALDAQAAQAKALREALEQQRHLDALVAQLSLPVLPVRSDVLIIPVVGTLDSGRAGDLQRRVLGQIERQAARAVMLDITGVTLVDELVARTLIDTALGARLLGARTLLVGIRPEVAQALVGLGLDLSALEPYATLHQGLDGLLQDAPARRAA